MDRTFVNGLRGKKALVVGLGKSGKAAATELHALGAEVILQDKNDRSVLDEKFLSLIENEGISGYFGSEPEDMGAFDLLVLSPGVPVDQPFIMQAKEAGAEIIGELELAYRLSDGKFIAITGTNGKTTTTTLVGEIFKTAGKNVKVVGNIGVAAATEAREAGPDEWLVTECSSFQLETVSEFRPLVSAILNLTPDHLNRHKTMEAYAAAKANIYRNQTADDCLVINKDDPACFELAKDCKARIIPFSRKEILEEGAYCDGAGLYLNDGENCMLICHRDELKIIGDHNVENVLAAAAIAYYAGIPVQAISETVRAFNGVEHRIEYCGMVDGVKYYNDSKGTNVDAAVIALKALEKDIILIAGGDGKAQDFTELGEQLLGRVKTLILFGRDAEQIGNAALAAGFEQIVYVKDMNDCVRKAAEVAVPGDSVLLSPACASWDMYDNYEQRGRHFKTCVAELER